MKPMSRFTGCIAAEQRRIELLELVANQRTIPDHASAPVALRAMGRLSQFMCRLRNLHFGPEWRESRVSGPTSFD
jgi:hypothetical protein